MVRPCCIQSSTFLARCFRVLSVCCVCCLLASSRLVLAVTEESLRGTSEFVSFRFKFPSPNLVDLECDHHHMILCFQSLSQEFNILLVFPVSEPLHQYSAMRQMLLQLLHYSGRALLQPCVESSGYSMANIGEWLYVFAFKYADMLVGYHPNDSNAA